MPAPRPAYFAPRTLDEAVQLLSQHGGAACLLAGGTDLLLKMERGQLGLEALISLNRIDGLRGVSFDAESGLSIGATARLADILEFAPVRRFYPALARAISQTATVPIRNMGTLVGNVCNASPCADNVPTLLARSARLEAVCPTGARWIDLDGFFRSPGVTSLAADEIVRRIQVPPHDMPTAESACIEVDEPRGPFGAKESGEGPISPTAPAIAEAVWHATGYRCQDLPITPEKVLRAIEEQGS